MDNASRQHPTTLEAPVEQFCLHVRGRLSGVTPQRLAALVAAVGGRLVATPSACVSLLCLAHSTGAKTVSQGGVIKLPSRIPSGCRIVSELTLKRLIGLAPPLPPLNRILTAAELAQQARLSPETLRCLALYDVVEPAGDAFGYRDLLAAREVARLLRADLPLTAIIQASVAIRRFGRTLSDTRLSEAPWGEVLQEVAGRFARLDGQFTLPLAESFETLDDVFERAEEMELKGNLEEAERLYRLATRIDRTDPVLGFNLRVIASPKEAANRMENDQRVAIS